MLLQRTPQAFVPLHNLLMKMIVLARILPQRSRLMWLQQCYYLSHSQLLPPPLRRLPSTHPLDEEFSLLGWVEQCVAHW